MKNNMQLWILLLVSLSFWVLPLVRVKALAPPDVIYNIMQQLPQMIAMVFGFFSMISFGIYNYFKLIGSSFKLKPWQWLIIIGLLLIASIGIGYLISFAIQQNALNNAK